MERKMAELKLVADMLRQLGKNGMTAKQAEDIAQRVEEVASSLSSVDVMVGTASKQLLSEVSSDHGCVMNGEVKKEFFISPLQLQPKQSTLAKLPEKPKTPRNLKISKPISSVAALFAGRSMKTEAIFETQKVNADKEIRHVMPATLYLLLEGAVSALRAEGGNIYMLLNDEMTSICNVGPKICFPPALVRHMGANSITGGVFASGVAVNQYTKEHAQDDNGKHLRSLLIFPIFSTRKNESNGNQKVIAVVQASNKFRGRGRFNEADEHFLGSVCALFSYIIEAQNVHWPTTYYDPITLHSRSPFEAASLTHDVGRVLGDEMLCSMLPRDYIAPRLIQRVELPITLSKRRALREDATALNAAPSLLEIDTYLANLSDCWRRSVHQNVLTSASEAAKLAQVKGLREELNKSKLEAAELSEQLRLQQLDVGDYRKEYSNLRQELDSYLKEKRNFD